MVVNQAWKLVNSLHVQSNFHYYHVQLTKDFKWWNKHYFNYCEYRLTQYEDILFQVQSGYIEDEKWFI